MGKVRTHDHKSPKRAGLSSRVPLDALQTVVAPEMVEKEHKELKQSTSALGTSTETLRRVRGKRESPKRERRLENRYSSSSQIPIHQQSASL